MATVDAGLLDAPGSQVPLAAGLGQPDTSQWQQNAYTLANEGTKYNQQQSMARDQQVLQNYLKQGGDLITPDGVMQATAQLKGQLSEPGYEKLVQMHDQRDQIEAAARKRASELPDQLLAQRMSSQSLITQAAQGSLAQIKEIEANKGDPEAESKRQAILQAAIGPLVQAKAITPQQAQSALSMTTPQLEAFFNGSQYQQGFLTEEAKRREMTARAKYYESGGPQPTDIKDIKWAEGVMADPDATPEDKAIAKNLVVKKTTPVGSGAGALNDEEKAALNKAVTSGKLDVNHINSRTAKIYADMAMANPDADFAGMSADINLIRNPTLRQKMMNAEVLPEVMNNMVTAGKKLDLSHVKVAGQMEMWQKGQLNDPDWVEYLALRNDALFMIAGTMRGVGMTDEAKRSEDEVTQPTMDGPALDAWLRGQMKSLAPRIREFHKIEARGQTPDQSTPPVKQKPGDIPTVASKEALQEAIKAGALKKGDQFVDPDGKPHWVQ